MQRLRQPGDPLRRGARSARGADAPDDRPVVEPPADARRRGSGPACLRLQGQALRRAVHPHAGVERRRRRAHHGAARRQRLLVLQRQFLRRRGRRNPRPGRMQLPAQQPHDPERRDDRLGDRNRRRPGMAGRLRADDRSLGRPLLPGPHAYPPPESLALRRGDRERRDRPGFLLLGRRRGRLRRSGSRKDPTDALDGRGTRRTEAHRRLPAGVFARRRARRRHLHVGTLDRLRLQGRRAGLRLDHVRGHEGRAHLSLHDQAGGARLARAGGPHRDARPGQPVELLHPRPERRLPVAEHRADRRGDGALVHHRRVGVDAVGVREGRNLLHVRGGLPLRPRHLHLPQRKALRALHRPHAALHAARHARQAGQPLSPALVHDQPPPGALAAGRAGLLDQQRSEQLLGQLQPRGQRRLLPPVLLPRL